MTTDMLKGQVALISGGLGDIARAIALNLADHGADIALSDIRSREEYAELGDALSTRGVKHAYHQVDVTKENEVSGWIDDVSDSLGVPTLIIVNAGTVEMADFTNITPETWKRQLDVNLNGAFYMAHFATQNLLKHQKEGRVVFIGSWAAHAVHTHIPAYSVSKAGLRSLCQNMAFNLASHGILVNEVAPGTVQAGLSAAFYEDKSYQEGMCAIIPNRRLIQPEEVALEVAHLCDPAVVHHVGTVIVIDGGNTLRGTMNQP